MKNPERKDRGRLSEVAGFPKTNELFSGERYIYPCERARCMSAAPMSLSVRGSPKVGRTKTRLYTAAEITLMSRLRVLYFKISLQML